MIGGGAYSYPKSYLREFPWAEMDVIEIDPALTELAKKYFMLNTVIDYSLWLIITSRNTCI